MEGQYNLRSPAVKRLMREAQELSNPTEQYFAQPLEDNLFEWHFTIRGPSDSDFDGGIYHGRIILPPDYPMKPPSIMFLTTNGRFECFTKICLSISKHHPESWQPSWSIRTALLAIIGFMPSPGHGAIGSLDYTPAERQQLAKKSRTYRCEICGNVCDKILPLTSKSDDSKQEMMDLAAQLSMVGEKEKISRQQRELGDCVATAPSTPSASPLSNTADLRQRINSNISAEPGQDSSAPSTAPSETATVAASSLDSTTTAGPGSAPAAPSPRFQKLMGRFHNLLVSHSHWS
ncbi:UBE2J1 [Bugula neritina]|uniref:UBE2J1 n=1 Tax=Bugula neritina TaxID=10212 RepID=A0A7J7JIQ2_BUGNE|nr:UBE2J1 [Bugula neritina]